mmetsp:Transcript_63799/g.152143  ORF Transcript_63799/g.152143 Transcript_63799/m.152143 type:complete len:303 (+) Transcript_63799:112-1020(+)|eukprot:CAMPEP_0178390886 /NCGR_PEP_ID=MMETSP0689_2-20121128/10876_1 /TAXON_ID=160604 /ORGANISM="Amphidinium massartii, Strain CS-259" /LENGTH=302 /DNA_ID=CAMNT_0020011407 /DNA_START=112 /DNA_END=1020 /DNA_ORIENTATION=+
MELLAEGVVGGIGGLVGRTAAFPLDTLKIKLATSKAGATLASVLRETLATDGVLGLYKGLPFSAFEGMYQKSLFGLFYETFKRLYQRSTGSKRPKDLVAVLFGYFSDLCCIPFSMPLEAMVVRLQSAPPGASHAEIIRQGLFTWSGLVKAWSSGKAYFILSWKPGIEFALFDLIKQRIQRDGKERDLDAFTAFGLGAIARAVATCVVYPYARAKAMVQAQLAPHAIAAVRKIIATEGIAALYKGLNVELLRGVTQAAVMFMVMERVRKAVRLRILGKLPRSVSKLESEERMKKRKSSSSTKC